MPADETYNESHALAVKTQYQAGCHSDRGLRDPQAGYWARDGVDMATDQDTGITYAITKMVWVPHAMSRDCRQITELAECKDCTQPRDWDYKKKWRGV